MPTTKRGLGRIKTTDSTVNRPTKKLRGMVKKTINKNQRTKNIIPPTFSLLQATSKATNKKNEGIEWMKKPPNAKRLKPASNTSRENIVKKTIANIASTLGAQYKNLLPLFFTIII